MDMDRDRDDVDPALRGVVRSYSLRVEEERPDDTLSQALGASTRHEIAEEQRQQEDSWPAWLRSHEQHSDEALLRLEEHKRDTAKRWQDFNAEHQVLQQLGVLNGGQGPPRLHDLLQAAQDAEAAWKKKKDHGLGKTKSAIGNFMNTMNSHSCLFSVIPNNDKYTSLITGVITSIAKAFVNHKKIAELFSEALERVANDLATVQASVQVSDTPRMRLRVVDLYIAVFDLLCHAMDWYGGSKRSRLMRSLRDDYADTINTDTDKVKDALSCIRLEAEQATQLRVQDTNRDVKGVHGKFEAVFQKLENIEQLVAAGERDRQDPAASAARLESVAVQWMLSLGQKAMRTLVATGEAQLLQDRQLLFVNALSQEGRRSPLLLRDSSGEENMGEVRCDSPDNMSDIMVSYTRDDIQKTSAPFLKDYLKDGRSDILGAADRSASDSSLPDEVVEKLAAWIKSPSSAFLWVEGPVHTPAEHQLSVIAVLLWRQLLSGKDPIPCVLFTPKLEYPAREVPDSTSRQERVLIGLLYSLAGQLVPLLPEELDAAPHRFEAQVFENLDGSVASVLAALDLIESLLAHGPPNLVVILNRLQVAECPRTTPHLERLVRLLMACDAKRNVKGLFITQGSSVALAGTLDDLTEKADAGRMAQAGSGQPPKGWTSLGNLSPSVSEGPAGTRPK